ncbi:hypothetical protein [Lacticaseibacillus manihotivorans]|jgi:hypothetical protein|nr:hypothetical protein [Lacticaseibacillus manihotivorans]QFQ90804.1 hypothetical protein LM010_04945 [Lacticaseibacillus manihotivorans]
MINTSHPLSEHADFTTGVLQTRISDPINETPSNRMIFNPLAETPKYVHGDSELPVVPIGSVAVSMLQHRAFLVLPEDHVSELILTANFTALSFDNTIDPAYFTWWFNCSHEAQSQLQGRGQLGRRVVVRDLKELKITLPDLTTQTDIAQIYQDGVTSASLYRKLADTVEEKSLQFIQQRIVKESTHD